MLKKRQKGTGGAPGLAIFFEGWNDSKLEKYYVNMDTYDHIYRRSRPSIIFLGYCSQKTPYLAVINLWDKKSDYLLSSRYDPLNIGRGEVGLSRSNEGTNEKDYVGKKGSQKTIERN